MKSSPQYHGRNQMAAKGKTYVNILLLKSFCILFFKPLDQRLLIDESMLVRLFVHCKIVLYK